MDIGNNIIHNSWAHDINNSGDVVGYADYSDRFVWNEEYGIDFIDGTCSSHTPISINNLGDIVSSDHPSGHIESHNQSYLYDENGKQFIDLPGNEFNTESNAYIINDDGYVAGTYYNYRLPSSEWNPHMYIWHKNTGFKDLGVGRIKDMNNLGQVAGYRQLENDQLRFVYDIHSDTYTYVEKSIISTHPQWRSGGVKGINDKGWMIGEGIKSNGQHGAFLITPEPIPEPTTMLLFGTGLLGLVGYGRKMFYKKS